MDSNKGFGFLDRAKAAAVLSISVAFVVVLAVTFGVYAFAVAGVALVLFPIFLLIYVAVGDSLTAGVDRAADYLKVKTEEIKAKRSKESE